MSLSLNEIAKNNPRYLQPLELFAACKLNCLQAVLSPFLEAEAPETRATIMSLTSALGGGVAGMGELCGALLGAVMQLSLAFEGAGLSPEESEQRILLFIRQFGQQYGTLSCSVIKAQAGKEAGYEACQVLVVNTIESLDRVHLELNLQSAARLES
jgi:C_GCAxxG_C_C family probable redox protein